MVDFFKGSVRELKHVVWPTREETKKFFVSVLIILILFGIYLMVAEKVFSETLLFLKDMKG